jgi:prolyl-tRNA synthetase
MQEQTRQASDYETFKEIMDGPRGFIEAGWCGDADCEATIQEESRATIRCLPFDREAPGGSCIRCDNPAKHLAIFAKAY